MQSLSSLQGESSRYSIDGPSMSKNKQLNLNLNYTIDAAIKDLSPLRDYSVVNKRKTKLVSILNTKEGSA